MHLFLRNQRTLALLTRLQRLLVVRLCYGLRLTPYVFVAFFYTSNALYHVIAQNKLNIFVFYYIILLFILFDFVNRYSVKMSSNFSLPFLRRLYLLLPWL